MILRNATIKYKGYDPSNLKSQSNKRICCSCDECGRVRWIPKQSYRNLCKSCCQKGHQNNLGKQFSKKSKKNMSNAHIGKYISLKTRIKMSCSRHNISIKDFNEFLTEQKYCYKFNNQLKIQIRNKYNNCDYISGIHKDICNKERSLDVHHVDYDKMQGCGKNFNLIPLSHVNHSKTNTNRLFWNRLFIYSLEIDKTYYGDDI